LPVALVEERFRVEGIDLADPSLHEQEDDSLGSRCMVQLPGGMLCQQTGCSQASKSARGLLQESATMFHEPNHRFE
jgi:hypothetical protein